MKVLFITFLFLLCLPPVAAEPLCKMESQDPEQVLDQVYWNKEKERLQILDLSPDEIDWIYSED